MYLTPCCSLDDRLQVIIHLQLKVLINVRDGVDKKFNLIHTNLLSRSQSDKLLRVMGWAGGVCFSINVGRNGYSWQI